MSQIRRTQFLTTYGPGAILESVNGPRIILSVELSGVFPGTHTDFEITDQRLSRGMLDGAGILRLPSNAELGDPTACLSTAQSVFRCGRYVRATASCIKNTAGQKKTSHALNAENTRTKARPGNRPTARPSVLCVPARRGIWMMWTG